MYNMCNSNWLDPIAQDKIYMITNHFKISKKSVWETEKEHENLHYLGEYYPVHSA